MRVKRRKFQPEFSGGNVFYMTIVYCSIHIVFDRSRDPWRTWLHGRYTGVEIMCVEHFLIVYLGPMPLLCTSRCVAGAGAWQH